MIKSTPRFTGIFIPVEIMELDNLIPAEKMLLGIIDAYYDKSKGGCWASNEYLAEKVGMKPNTVAKSLVKLRKMDLIENVSYDGRIRVIRAKIGKFIDKCQSKSELDYNPRGVGLKSKSELDDSPNPSYIYNKGYRKDITSQNAEAFMRLSKFLFEKIKEKNPKAKKPNFEKWADHIRLAIEEDERTIEELEEMINWVHNDNFWFKVILSTKSLRDKFDQIKMQMIGNKAISCINPKEYFEAHCKNIGKFDYGNHGTGAFSVFYFSAKGGAQPKIYEYRINDGGILEKIESDLRKINEWK